MQPNESCPELFELFILTFLLVVEDTPLGQRVILLLGFSHLETFLEFLNQTGPSFLDFSLQGRCLVTRNDALAIHFLRLVTHAFNVLLQKAVYVRYFHLSVAIG